MADCALRDAPDEATEQHVGICVFQRTPGYNCAEDNIVRTHARALRQKLAEYFQNEGSQEETIIEIPKGHYLPVFHSAIPPAPMLPAVAALGKTSGNSKLKWLLLAVLLTGVLAGAGWWRADRTKGDSAINRLWGPFFADNDSLVIYSNPLFVGNAIVGLRYASPPDDPRGNIGDNYVASYTGVGEVVSTYDLSRLFASRHANFTLKRSLLVTWDEAKLKNLIFIGGVEQNPALRIMPATTDFTPVWETNSSGIVNRHPRPGELPIYSRPDHPLTRDYAILALLPGFEPGRKSLVFGGLTTMGTQAAVDFACRPEGAKELVHLATRPDGTIHPFEAVIETTLGGGVPIQAKLVAMHVHD
ncbi:MAG: hypothetical protein ACYCSN_14830 [Acidobacteriaceae bacterium]